MTASLRRHLDPGSVLVILITLALFVTALFMKGLGHDLLLEGGVFLVSVKLIMMAHKQSLVAQSLTDRLDGIRATLSRLERTADPAPRSDDPEAARRARD